MSKKNTEAQYYVSEINTSVMNYKVYVMKPSEKLIYMALLMIVGGIVGLIFYGGLFKAEGENTIATHISNIVVFCVFGILANKFFMQPITNMLKNRRIKVLKEQFRDFLVSFSNCLSGGMNVNDSLSSCKQDLEAQFSSDSYIVAEINELINGVHNNIPIEKLMASFGQRSGVDDIVNFATVFDTAYRTGGNLKEIVRRTTDIISEKMLISEEIQTKLTSNKMQMNAMLVIPVILMLMLKTMSSEFAESFASIIGVVCITVSIGLFFAAYKIGQKIMDIKG